MMNKDVMVMYILYNGDKTAVDVFLLFLVHSEEVVPHIDSTSALCLFDHLNFQEDIDKMK